jgi:bifunctional DNA-binding transcriptional regulator/antitoxin component of YhaV-PrlF toxin-antitoxin module
MSEKEEGIMNVPSPVNLRPAAGTRTGRVWEIADRISAEKGRQASRGQVIEASVSEGINPNTASTQYHHWKQDWESREARKSVSALPSPGSSQRVVLQIGQDGRLLIPAELRSLMMIGEDGKLSAVVKDGELRIKSPLMALLRLQQLVKERDTGTGSPVDELLAERRAEALRE